MSPAPITGGAFMILRVENISKQYRIGGVKKRILDGIDLSLEGGRICSITGMSGCGKTTLLNVIAGITRPGGGAVYINGRKMVHGLDLLASRRRNRDIGFIFQTLSLIHI